MPGPYGAGRGRGRRRRKGMGRVRRFLEPCLLLLLRRGEAHGYKLVSELEKFGFDPQSLDPSLVYRALRDMENMAWISARTGEDSQGPPRRVYKLAPEGETHLDTWVQNLRRTRDEINRLLRDYEEEQVEEDE
jgi:PadR family transcriptional regulator PadR